MTKILLALDGSEGSMAGIEAVRELAGVGTTIILVTVLPVPTGREDPAITSVPYNFLAVPEDVRPSPQGETSSQAIDRLTEDVTSRLEVVANELRHGGLIVRCQVAFGKPAEEILRLAEAEQVDCLAVATHGNTGVRSTMLGSVASDLIHARKFPIIVAPWRTAGAK